MANTGRASEDELQRLAIKIAKLETGLWPTTRMLIGTVVVLVVFLLGIGIAFLIALIKPIWVTTQIWILIMSAFNVFAAIGLLLAKQLFGKSKNGGTSDTSDTRDAR